MNSMRPPEVYAALGELPLTEAPEWTTLDGLRKATVSRRMGEAGTATLVLDNRDRALEAEYAASPFYPDVKPNLRMRLVHSEGNLLDLDTAGADRGMGTVAEAPADTLAVYRTTEQAADGLYSFGVTGDGALVGRVSPLATATTAPLTSLVPVTAGDPYTAVASFRAKTTTRSCNIRIDWFDAAGVRQAQTTGVAVTNTNSGWTQIAVSANAPTGVGVVFAAVVATTGTPAASEVHFVDRLGLTTGLTTPTWVPGYSVVADAYVDSLPPSYVLGANGGDSVVTASCTDLTKFLARTPVRPPYEVEVAADSPLHWWPLGEAPHSDTFADSGSSPFAGTLDATAILGAAPVVRASSLTSLELPAYPVGGATFPAVTGDWTCEVVIDGLLETDSSTYQQVVRLGPVGVDMSLIVGTTSSYAVQPTVSTVGGQAVICGPILVKLPFVFAVTKTGTVFEAFINGISRGSWDATTFPTDPLDNIVLGASDTPGAGFSDLTGRAGHVSVYSGVLSDVRLLAHAEAARDPWEGDSTDARIARLLTQVGVPEAWHDLSLGYTTELAPVYGAVEGKKVLDLVRVTNATEMGWTFATADGYWRLIGRRDLADDLSAATFGDGTGEVPYIDLVPDYSETDVIRTATITRDGGNPQTYTDPAAVAGDAIFDGSRDGLLYGTDGEAYDAAAWLVNEHKDPHLRFRRLTLTGERSTTVMRLIASLDLGSKVTVIRRPPGGGAQLERTVMIVGVTHDIDCQARTWRATYELDPVDTTDYWTLGDAVFGLLDTTTVLAF